MSNRYLHPDETFRDDDPDTDVVTATRRKVAFHNREAQRKGNAAPSPRTPDKQGSAFKNTLAFLGASAVLTLAFAGTEKVSHMINGTPSGGAKPAMKGNPYEHNSSPKPDGLTVDGPTTLPPQDTLPPSLGH